jgi:hypothetical protein
MAGDEIARGNAKFDFGAALIAEVHDAKRGYGRGKPLSTPSG